MKKIYYFGTILCLMFMAFSLDVKSVLAKETLKLGREENIYYTRQGGGKPYNSDFYPLYSMDGKVVYCIEPGVGIYFYEYTGTMGISKSPYNAETNYLIQLIGHYGYEYPGHNNIRYRMATQALLWEKLGGQTVEFYTERYGEGKEIDVSYEKNQIMKLVNNHKVKPNFSKTKIVGEVGSTIVLEDKNKVLSNFSIIDDGINEIKKEGNKLYITLKKAGNFKIKLKKAKYDSKATIVYSSVKGIGQKVAILRASDEVEMEMDLEVKSKLKIIKVDDNGDVIKKSGFKFKLKDLKTNEYICENDECVFETNNEGEFETKTGLLGEYELEEIDTRIDGYLYNSNKLKIVIDSNTNVNNNVITFKFQNKRAKGKLIIHKKGEQLVLENNSFGYKEIPLENVKFDLIAADNIYYNNELKYKKGDLVETLKTDELGNIVVNDLYLGKYYLEEIESVSYHMLDKEKYYFELTYNNQYEEVILKEFNLKNYLPKGRLEFLKVDSKTGISLPDTLIEIYKKADPNIENDVDKLVYRGKTDMKGMIILDNLVVGNYYIKEAKSKDGYYLSSEIIDFEINENGDIVSLKMENMPVNEEEVPKTGIDNSWFKKMITISLILITLPSTYLIKIRKSF